MKKKKGAGPCDGSASFALAELVGRFGPDRFARLKRKDAVQRVDPDDPGVQAPQMHFHPPRFLVPARFVRKAVPRKMATQLPVDPAQDVQVEGGRHAARVVVGSEEGLLVLAQIEPEQK